MLARAAAAQDDARDVSRPMRAAPARPHPRPCFTRHLGIVLTANEFLCTLMARVVHAPNHPGMQKRTVGGDALLPRSRTTRGRCARVHASVHHQLKGTLMFRAACIECIYAGHSNRERDSADVLSLERRRHCNSQQSTAVGPVRARADWLANLRG